LVARGGSFTDLAAVDITEGFIGDLFGAYVDDATVYIEWEAACTFVEVVGAGAVLFAALEAKPRGWRCANTQLAFAALCVGVAALMECTTIVDDSVTVVI
tara:strand:- start:33018 stop:33317 length:300 start_codon:yes stop_codon:yes gene_type:complete